MLFQISSLGFQSAHYIIRNKIAGRHHKAYNHENYSCTSHAVLYSRITSWVGKVCAKLKKSIRKLVIVTYCSCEQLYHIAQSLGKGCQLKDVLPDRQQICISNLLRRVDTTPHGNHTGYLTPPCVSIKVVLDLRECIITGVVGKNSTIHIVVTLSEVDRSCRGVPSSFPYRDCVCVCVCVCGLVGGCGCGCGCGWVCECRWVECTCMCECVYSGDYT